MYNSEGNSTGPTFAPFERFGMTSTLTSTPAATVFGEAHLRTDGDLLLVAFGPDGSLWSIEASGLLRHWTAAGQPLSSVALSDLETEWAFSKDARVLASASKDLGLWDTATGRELSAVPQETWISAIAFNADSAFVATGHDDGTVRYWNRTARALVHTLSQHKTAISALAFHPDGKTLAVASEDCTITLWNVETGQLLRTLTGHTDRIPALAWHPTKQILVSAGWDTTARVWDAATGSPIILLNDHATQVNALAVSPDGKLLATVDSAQKIRVWDFAGNKLLRTLTGPTVEVRSLAFAPDGSTLAATGDRVVHLWNAVTGQSLSGSEQRSKVKSTASVNHDGTLLASNAGGLAVKIWNVASKQLQSTLTDAGQIHQVAFSPKSPLLAAACGDRVRLWDSATGKVHLDLDGPEEPLALVAFSPDGTTLAASGYVGTSVWLWSTTSGEPLLVIPDPLAGYGLQAIAFHPQGRLLAVAGIDWLATSGSTGAISIWDLKTRSKINSLPEGSMSIAFDPRGHRLAASTRDCSIVVYDAVSFELQTELIGHDGAIDCLAYSPSGDLLASGDDETIRFWNDAGDEIALIEVDSKVTTLSFSPDGKSLFAAHANTTCTKYDVPQG